MKSVFDTFAQTSALFGTTADDFSETLLKFSTHIAPFSELDVASVMINPSLSWFQKKVIIHKMKKLIPETRK